MTGHAFPSFPPSAPTPIFTVLFQACFSTRIILWAIEMPSVGEGMWRGPWGRRTWGQQEEEERERDGERAHAEKETL